ncbi:hypothetical protein Tco_0693667 [Tanacetum coccineum]
MPINDVKQIHAIVDGKTVVISESSVRSDLHFNDEDGITCLTNTTIFENLALMRIEEQILVTESSSPQNTQSHRKALEEDTQFPQTSVHIPNVEDEAFFMGVDARVVPGSHGGVIAQTRSDRASKQSYDSPIPGGGHTSGSDEGRPNINKLMAVCTNMSNRVLTLEQSKTAQDLVIRKLKKKVRKLEMKLRERTLGMKLFKIGTSKRKSLDEEYVSKQGRKSDKTKPMFDDSDFTELDVDNAMENVEGDAKTQGRKLLNKLIRQDTVNILVLEVSAAGTFKCRTKKKTSVIVHDVKKNQEGQLQHQQIQPSSKGYGFRRGTIDKTLFIKKDKDDAQEIPDEFYRGAHFLLKVAVKTVSTPIKTNKALLKDEEAEDADVHLYRSMIGSLMYLTASRPDIIFAVCACTRFQVTPEVSHLHAVKRIIRYLEGQPKLGLWYPRDSSFNLEAFSDSDYAGASLDKKSTT